VSRFLKQSTAFAFRIGPFMDEDDQKTPEVGLTIAQGDIQISKDGAAFGQTSDAAPTTTHDADGWYQCPLTTTDTGTRGTLTVKIHMAGALPVYEHFEVLLANVFDSLIAGSDSLEVDTVAVSGDTTAADNLETMYDGTGYTAETAPSSRAQVVGYADGAIWVDTNASNTNTASYVDGTADNPVSTWAAALTLDGQLGLHRFHIGNGSSITLTGNSDNYTLFGEEWTLVLGTQSCASAAFYGAHVTGVCSGTGVVFKDCSLADGNSFTFYGGKALNCALAGDIFLVGVATYYFDNCYSGVAGAATPSIDFGDFVIGDTNLNMRHYSGGIEIKGMGGAGSDLMSLEGHGQLVINANCSAGTIAIRGHFTVTDNAAGAVTLSDDARYDVAQINAEVDTALVDYGPNTTVPDVAGTAASLHSATDALINALNDLSAAQVNAEVDTALTDYGANTTVPDVAGTAASLHSTTDALVATVDAIVDAIKVVTDKLADTVEDDAGTYRFTENALEEAPSGTGGDATAANQTAIIAHLTDVKGTDFTKDTNSLVDTALTGGDDDTLETISDQIDLVIGGGMTTTTITEDTIDVDGNVMGKVVDSHGTPIASARVVAYADADTGLTVPLYEGRSDGDGGFEVVVVDGATYRIIPIKSGYTFSVKRVTV